MRSSGDLIMLWSDADINLAHFCVSSDRADRYAERQL